MSRIEDALEKANQMRQSRNHQSECQDPLPIQQVASRKKPYLRADVIGLVALALVTVFGSYRFAPDAPDAPAALRSPPHPLLAESPVNPQAFVQPLVAAAPLRGFPRLPGIVPVGSPDPAYTAAHPGWQRFQSAALDFRVFRKDAVIEAVQVISKQKNAISGPFLASFLIEITGKNGIRIATREEKGDYRVERGTTGESAEIVIYRDKRADEIDAFVVAFR